MNDDPVSENNKELARLIEELDSMIVNVPDEYSRVRIWKRLMEAERDLANFWHKEAIMLRGRYDHEVEMSNRYIVKYERLKNSIVFYSIFIAALVLLAIAAFLIIAHLSENFQWKLFEDGSYVLTGCLPWMPCVD